MSWVVPRSAFQTKRSETSRASRSSILKSTQGASPASEEQGAGSFFGYLLLVASASATLLRTAWNFILAGVFGSTPWGLDSRARFYFPNSWTRSHRRAVACKETDAYFALTKNLASTPSPVASIAGFIILLIFIFSCCSSPASS